MVALIVAYAENRVIGNQGMIPWKIKGEQKRFRELTTGNAVVMGRRTFEEIGKPLPNRMNIVVSSTREFTGENCYTVPSLQEAIKLAGDRDVYISGGAGLYEEALPLVEKMYITEIEKKIEGDTYFPEFVQEDFVKEIDQRFEGEIPYTYVTYTRKRQPWRMSNGEIKERMQLEYRYSPKANYDDFSSGRVLYSARGVPNFPVRLQAEIFCRARQYLKKDTELCVYDPCCGGGYSLTILGFLFGDHIGRICGSDIDTEMIRIAGKNLSLLSEKGMAERSAEIESLYGLYHKESHAEALASCKRLGAFHTKHIQTEAFEADCTLKLPKMAAPDVIITDVPYGNLVEWSSSDMSPDRLGAMLHHLHEISTEKTVLAVCMDKRQKIVSDEWFRVEKTNVGKRRFEIYVFDRNLGTMNKTKNQKK